MVPYSNEAFCSATICSAVLGDVRDPAAVALVAAGLAVVATDLPLVAAGARLYSTNSLPSSSCSV